MRQTQVYGGSFTGIRFADPYKRCLRCSSWVDGVLEMNSSLISVPCGHRAGYDDICPSWSPMDGCRCGAMGIIHEMRSPEPGDHRNY